MTTQLDLQQAYDKMVIGLVSQNWQQSMGAFGGCAYQGTGSLKCAVGHLLPDGKDWNRYGSIYAICFQGALQSVKIEMAEAMQVDLDDCTMVDLLCDAQDAHDDYEDPFAMRARFIAIGKRYNLSLQEIDKCNEDLTQDIG